VKKKNKTAAKLAKGTSPDYTPRFLAKKKSFIGDILAFRRLKKVLVGKSQEESLDFLDRWMWKGTGLKSKRLKSYAPIG
jgi:hypothetical protein